MTVACICGGVLEVGLLTVLSTTIVSMVCGIVGFCVRCIRGKKSRTHCECKCHDATEDK